MKDFVAGAAARKLPNLDPDLNEIVGRPTGQGFGAARKGSSVVASSDKDLMKEEDWLWQIKVDNQQVYLKLKD